MKKGIPIMLCAVFHLLCARVGIEIAMNGAPYHFLCSTADGEIFIDPYTNKVMTKDNALLFIRNMTRRSGNYITATDMKAVNLFSVIHRVMLNLMAW